MRTVEAARLLLCLSPIACGATACSRQEPANAGPLRAASDPRRVHANSGGHASLGPDNRRLELAKRADQLTSRQAVDPTPGSSTPTAPQALVSLLARARNGGSTEVTYVVPTREETADYEANVAALLNQSSNPRKPLALPKGFDLETIEEQYLALVETSNSRRGAAALVIRSGDANALAIEVPHSFFDEETLPIGLAIFSATKAKLLLVNTVHRYRSRPKNADQERSKEDDTEDAIVSDAAHAAASYFLSAHIAFGHSFPEGNTLQIHGYANASAPDFDAVVSSAATRAEVGPLAEELRHTLGLRVAEYPRDWRRLGGMKNVQAAWSRRTDRRFIHIELSQTLRKRLAEDLHLRDRFATSVARTLR